MSEKHCALITGSSSGIGLGIAEVFAQNGIQVILHGLEPEDQLKKIASHLSAKTKQDIDFISLDLGNQSTLEKFFTEKMSRFQNVDILVNNAGIQHVSPIETFPLDKWNLLLQLHLTVPFYLSRIFLPQLRQKKFGRIINIASVHGMVASENKSAYVSAKHGVIGLTKTIALETAGSGVTCNAICPGWVRTPLVEAQIEAKAKDLGISIPDAAKELLREKQPSLAFTETSDLGAMALFLCSDAARNLTGQSIALDGAWTAR